LDRSVAVYRPGRAAVYDDLKRFAAQFGDVKRLSFQSGDEAAK
jgi:hypothetical protein